ncbi:MAG TPA: hypothetical protein PK711_02370 [Bacteroidales bacterium]|nr:hypothetical protein [Bacteroidales bacterium]
MKDLFVYMMHCLLSTIFTCLVLSANAQYIIAGQTSGNHIYYFDIEDVIFYAEPNNPVTFPINIDGGWFDLQFGAYLFIGHYSTSYGSEVAPLGSTSISVLIGEDNWINKFNPGDTIDFSLIWQSEPGILESYYEDDFGNSVIQGVFHGEGYMGFKIDSPDFIIGWIRLDIFWSEVTIYDYAFYSDTYVSDIEINKQDFEILFQNPVTDNLLLHLNSSYENTSYYYRLFNLPGRELENGILHEGSNTIDLQHLSSGVFMLQVWDRCGFHRSYIVLKE